jgi:hypothetical protein
MNRCVMCGEDGVTVAITTPAYSDPLDNTITGANTVGLCKTHADASLMQVIEALWEAK